jgi:Tfp pilus assembly protein FimT
MRGFTLLTLLVIMAVMATLSAILFPRLCQAPDKPTTTFSANQEPQDMADSDI